MDILEIKNLNFTYPEANEHTLCDVNFSVKKGEFIVLFGASGSGKTTLLKLLKHELSPYGNQTGNIYYQGQKLENVNEKKRASDIGLVMQNPHTQIVTNKVWHELAFGLENLGLSTSRIRGQVGEVASYFGIHHWFHQNTNELSGGQKQLLNLASTMVMQPEVLLLDEPTAQLDPIASKRFIQTIEELNRDLGITIILVEHELENILYLADKAILLEKGEVIYNNSPHLISSEIKAKDENHPMLEALPTATKLFNKFNIRNESPLTLREGKEFLEKHEANIQFNDRKENERIKTRIILQLKDVWFRYERKSPDVLTDVQLNIHKGEVISILGGNGAGKSTLLQVMAGQYRPYKGSVLLNNKQLHKYKGKKLYRNQLALLPQNPQLLFLKNTVMEDYEHFCKVHELSKKEQEEKIKEVIDKLALHDLLTKHPQDLSGGELQKVALGKLLLINPQILFLDEPTKGIDAFWKRNIQYLIKELQNEGKTIIIVTHDIEFSAHVSDRVGLYFDSEIISLNSPKEFFRNNSYYTTSVSRMTRNVMDEAILIEDISIKET